MNTNEKFNMTRRAWLGLAAGGAIVALGGRRLWATSSNGEVALGAGRRITVYASPSCGCCHKWMEHLEKNGFSVAKQMMDDVSPKKKELGVPEALWSCHTGVIDGYLVEGHVPADLIAKMLDQHAAIAGLAAPGMPASAPGMDIGHESYDIISFTRTGKTAVYATRTG